MLLLIGVAVADTFTVDQLVKIREAGYGEQQIIDMIRKGDHRVAALTRNDRLHLANAGFTDGFIDFLAGRAGDAKDPELTHVVEMCSNKRPVDEILDYIRTIQPYKLAPLEAIKLTQAGVPLLVRVALTGRPLSVNVVTGLGKQNTPLWLLNRLADIIAIEPKELAAEDAAKLAAAGVPNEFIARMKKAKEEWVKRKKILKGQPPDPRMFGKWRGVPQHTDDYGRSKPAGEIILVLRRDRSYEMHVFAGTVDRDWGVYSIVDNWIILASDKTRTKVVRGADGPEKKKVKQIVRARFTLNEGEIILHDLFGTFRKVRFERVGDADAGN
jgi:hypothetical protein